MGAVNTSTADLPGLSVPEPLGPAHDLSDFHCGEDTLDEWLRRWASKNESAGASRTYVTCSSNKVYGYYCLAAGSVGNARVPGRIKRNMPDPIPVMVIGRLAVHCNFQGHGLGLDLLADAVRRTRQAAGIAGIRAILVHAISEDAVRFYQKAGFLPSPIEPTTLMTTIGDVESALGLLN